jgi:hypothetical protein
MSDEDIKAFCSLLLAAGGETTDKAIAGILTNLLLHPEQLAAVRADRSLIVAAFAETLRHTPPVHMIMRQAATDVQVRSSRACSPAARNPCRCASPRCPGDAHRVRGWSAPGQRMKRTGVSG